MPRSCYELEGMLSLKNKIQVYTDNTVFQKIFFVMPYNCVNLLSNICSIIVHTQRGLTSHITKSKFVFNSKNSLAGHFENIRNNLTLKRTALNIYNG